MNVLDIQQQSGDVLRPDLVGPDNGAALEWENRICRVRTERPRFLCRKGV